MFGLEECKYCACICFVGKRLFMLFLARKVLKFVLWLGYFFYRMLPRVFSFKSKYGEGSWAVITGATDGIGKGFA